MSTFVLFNILVLGGISFVAASVLYIVSQKFKVKKDVLETQIEEVLPQANCGACGYAGCSAFARACFVADKESFSELYCPVGGMDVLKKIAKLKGMAVAKKNKTTAWGTRHK